jgi:hypothetical protein
MELKWCSCKVVSIKFFLSYRSEARYAVRLDIVTCTGLCVTYKTGSGLDEWIY